MTHRRRRRMPLRTLLRTRQRILGPGAGHRQSLLLLLRPPRPSARPREPLRARQPVQALPPLVSPHSRCSPQPLPFALAYQAAPSRRWLPRCLLPRWLGPPWPRPRRLRARSPWLRCLRLRCQRPRPPYRSQPLPARQLAHPRLPPARWPAAAALKKRCHRRRAMRWHRAGSGHRWAWKSQSS